MTETKEQKLVSRSNRENKIRNKTGFIIIFSALLFGCEQHYRYPCQHPENWDKEYCQKPMCEVNRDCPEYIFKGGESGLVTYGSNKPATPAKPGDCK